eukprot:TRINITY_DN22635_c0_g1_i1.p1 TRINITY_DN22635_c0_g1~~TRINITY_DN22635_c0_g1_i1.p1  ORF type:complete len:630 (+),score=234.10 TRINITY_DN22635_c0_g1_i1:61-1890(+)
MSQGAGGGTEALNQNVIDVDPRTGVPLQQLTNREHAEMQGKFRGLVVYYFGEVKKMNRKFTPEKRTLVISEGFLIFLKQTVQRKRDIATKDIVELVVDDRKYTDMLGLKCSPQAQYDCCIAFGTKAERDRVVGILVDVHKWLHRIGAVPGPLPVRAVLADTGETLQEALKLKRPANADPMGARITLTRQKELVNVPAEFRAGPVQNLVNHYEQHNAHHGDYEYPTEQNPPVDDEEDRKATSHVVQVFNQVHRQLISNLAEYRMAEIEEARGEVQSYVDMIDERDREIENLQQTYLSLTENPEFWRSCPTCKEAAYDAVAGAAHVDPMVTKKRQLERKLEEYRDLIGHMQMSRAAGGLECAHINSEVATMKKDIEALETKVRLLQRLIIEHPYPTEDVRIRADQIAEEDVAYLEDTDAAKKYQADIAEMQRTMAGKDRELQRCKSVLRDAFKRQVQELAGIRQQFQLYDENIVAYLEKVFAGNAYPQGPQAIGQTPLQIAQASSKAARQAATPPAFPQHTATVNMPRLAEQKPFSERYGTRRAASPIGSFVPPNVISPPSPAESPFYATKERAGGYDGDGSLTPPVPPPGPTSRAGFPGSAGDRSYSRPT